jgi:ribosomal protein L37AE/L43A
MEEAYAEDSAPEPENSIPMIRQVIDCPRCHRRGLMEVPETQDWAEYTCPKCGYTVKEHSWSARDAVRRLVKAVHDQARKNRISA